MADILLAHSDPEVGFQLRPALTRLGHQLVAVSDGRTALALLNMKRMNLVVCDRDLADMDGLTVIELSKQLYPSVPAILLSDDASAETISQAKHRGAYATLLTPIADESLISIMSMAMIAADLMRKRGFASSQAVARAYATNIG